MDYNDIKYGQINNTPLLNYNESLRAETQKMLHYQASKRRRYVKYIKSSVRANLHVPLYRRHYKHEEGSPKALPRADDGFLTHCFFIVQYLLMRRNEECSFPIQLIFSNDGKPIVIIALHSATIIK